MTEETYLEDLMWWNCGKRDYVKIPKGTTIEDFCNKDMCSKCGCNRRLK